MCIRDSYETMYKCRLGEGILEKHITEDEIRDHQPRAGFRYSIGQTVQIERPNGMLELARIVESRLDTSSGRPGHGEPWHKVRLIPSAVSPEPLVEEIHESDLRLPQPQAGTGFYVGQLVQATRKSGERVLARVLEFELKDYELQYKCAVLRI